MASKAIDLLPSDQPRRMRVAIPPLAIDAALMLIVALALRCWWFGDPVVQVDEQFYLLVGDRMLHGAMPFVDIWDRKPIGLFLIYAGIRLLGGLGILQYQIVATLFAGASALLVVRTARLLASETAARLAGVASLIWIIIFDGAGGQAPVFYNPLVAAAALVSIRAVIDRRTGASLTRAGALAMALLGVAMQIKYTVLSEGVGFGLLLSWHGLRSGERLRTLAGQMLLWIAIALAPTAAVLLFYALDGHGEAFLYANFISIGERPSADAAQLVKRLAKVALYGAPLVIAAGYGLTRTQTDGADRARRLVLFWAATALIGFLSIGSFYTHYFLPSVVPLAIGAAPAFDLRGSRETNWRVAIGLIGIGALVALILSQHRWAMRGDGRQVAALAAAVDARPGKCLFVFDGEPILYHLTNRCLTSRFAFPNHLNEHKEAPAIGIDPVAEVRRILAEKPPLIVSSNRPDKDANLATWAVMRAALASDYRPIAEVLVHHRVRIVYERDRAVAG